MKVVFIYGVGFHDDTSKHEKFLSEISEKTGVETEAFLWTHGRTIPQDDLPFRGSRDFFCEVVYDFQHVVKHAAEMVVPEADMYIGHSAGSIIALMQKKPSVLFGSPAILVESVEDNCDVMNEIYKNTCKTTNLINEFDLLAYSIPFNNVENIAYRGPWWSYKTYNPLSAHLNYFKSKFVINKTVEFIKDII